VTNVTNVMDNHFIFPDLIHNQIFSNWKPSKSRIASLLSHERKGSDLRRHLFDTSDEVACCLRIIRSHGVYKSADRNVLHAATVASR
jgi:hypothetical protein